MLGKLALYGFIIVIVLVSLFPGAIQSFLRRAGGLLGGAIRAMRELWTGKEVPGSPLSRYEVQAGRAVEERLLAGHRPVSNPALEEQVARIGARLAAAALRREIAFRFRVVEGVQPSAYAIPGGAVIITRPLVELCGGDDHQLAGVLAHEVVHIDRRHAVRHLATTAATRAGLKILTRGRGVLLARAVGAVESLMENGYPRSEELEADRLAVQLSARAGFLPGAYPHFLRSVLAQRLDGGGYFRTHPSIPERLRALET